jgi:hypothetical protein
MGKVVSAADALLEKRREEHRQAFLKQADEIIAESKRRKAERERAREAVVPFKLQPSGHLSEMELWRRQCLIDAVWQANLDRWAEEERRHGQGCHKGPGDPDY